MYRRGFDPFSECWRVFSSFAGCGGRRHYTRQERIEQLEKLKRELEKEIAGIDEAIRDLSQTAAS